jgi:DNA-binding NarL/FixJ family response regulator
MTIGVVVADDQAIVRAGFRLLIDSEPDLSVLGEAADGAEAIAVARRTGPDVVLMDIRMPVMDGIAATRLLAAGGTTPRVLILTTYDLDEYVMDALRAGASGFMLKDRPPEELLAAIRVIAAGDALLAPNVTRRLIGHFIRQPDPVRAAPAALAQLTIREREVLTLIAHGLSNTQIAEKLVMSVPTAKTHVSRILAKLGARDRAQLVVMAYQSGLVRALSRPQRPTSRSCNLRCTPPARITPRQARDCIRRADDSGQRHRNHCAPARRATVRSGRPVVIFSPGDQMRPAIGRKT